MKVNLTLGNLLPDYLNLGPVGHPLIRYCGITNLDSWLENSEATEIIADNVIGYLEPQYVDEAIKNWITKLRLGATIRVTDLDLHEVCRRFVRSQMNLDEANLLIYGDQSSPFRCRKNCLSIEIVESQFKKFGLSIVKKSFDNFFFSVEGLRVN